MKNLKKLALFAGLLLLFCLSNCKKAESPEPFNNPTNNPTVPPNPYTAPAVTFSSVVRGFAEDVNGKPIQGAIVSAGNKTATTDENGAFEINDAPFTGDFCYIKATKKGYFFGSATLHGKAGSDYKTYLVMQPQDNIVSFKATEAKTITVPGGATVNFPANAIKTLDGKPYTGNVNVAVAHIDPSADNFTMLIPGGDLRAYNLRGENVQLYSYGMLNVELKDDAGNYLQLADGQKSTLTMPVPANMQAKAPTTIPLWYFDENKGVWIEEGSATLKNGVYTGTVSHFTSWNCDWQGDRAYLKGKFIDCEGDVITDYEVRADQSIACINKAGEWERWVPAGMEIDVNAYYRPENLKLTLNKKSPKLTKDQVYDMGTITLPCRAKLKATITDCDDKPFSGYIFVKTSNVTLKLIITDGKLCTSIPSKGEQAEISFYRPAAGQLHTMNITLPTTHATLDLGKISACAPKTVSMKFSFDYDDGTGVQSVVFNDIVSAEGEYVNQQKILNINIRNESGSGQNKNIKTATININNPLAGYPKQLKIGDSASGLMVVHFITDKINFRVIDISVSVTKDEGVGGELSGVFTGILQYTDYNTIPYNPKYVTITNGKFSTIRLPNK